MVQREKFKKILILHPGAIGDVMLATPVAAALKDNFPEAQLSYWTHSSLTELLKLTNIVDEILVYNKNEGMLAQRNWLTNFGADLIVNLAGSFYSKLITFWLGGTVVHYRKQSSNHKMHAVENFLDTLRPLSLDIKNKYYPTIFPNPGDMRYISDRVNQNTPPKLKVIGLVPGVGKLRSHRAWSPNGFRELIRKLQLQQWLPILIGGPEDQELCSAIATDTGVLSMAGQLSLTQTAALLSMCNIVVSGDTGPAHLAVAVGTRVIGLYGPTFPARSGPYGCADLLIDRSNDCCCHKYKSCQIAQGCSACMQKISVDDIMAKLLNR